MQILKDGMQHVGKLICSNLGARMDSEPKRWRIFGLHLCSVAYLFALCYDSIIAYLVVQVNVINHLWSYSNKLVFQLMCSMTWVRVWKFFLLCAHIFFLKWLA